MPSIQAGCCQNCSHDFVYCTTRGVVAQIVAMMPGDAAKRQVPGVSPSVVHTDRILFHNMLAMVEGGPTTKFAGKHLPCIDIYAHRPYSSSIDAHRH